MKNKIENELRGIRDTLTRDLEILEATCKRHEKGHREAMAEKIKTEAQLDMAKRLLGFVMGAEDDN